MDDAERMAKSGREEFTDQSLRCELCLVALVSRSSVANIPAIRGESSGLNSMMLLVTT